MLKLKIDYPNKEQERKILDRMAVTDKSFDVKAVISKADIAEVRSVVDEIYIDESYCNTYTYVSPEKILHTISIVSIIFV